MSVLSHADLSRFFAALAHQLPCPAKLILTGGSEAMLPGGRRPTGDVDFGLIVAQRHAEFWPEIERAVAAAANEAAVVTQYSTDIDRWSSVAIPNKRFKTRPYKRVGRLSIHLLDPACWAVYKLTHYWEADVEDLLAVLARQEVSSVSLARLCGECLRFSPRSTHLFLFRKQVEHFFCVYGAKVWGKEFESQRAIAAFHRAAQIREQQ